MNERRNAPSNPSWTSVLATEHAFTVRASLAAPLVVGEGPEGLRRFIAITGGTVSGPLFNGTVVPGSGDWQVVRADGVLKVEARATRCRRVTARSSRVRIVVSVTLRRTSWRS